MLQVKQVLNLRISACGRPDMIQLQHGSVLEACFCNLPRGRHLSTQLHRDDAGIGGGEGRGGRGETVDEWEGEERRYTSRDQSLQSSRPARPDKEF